MHRRTPLTALLLLASSSAFAAAPQATGTFKDWNSWIYDEGGQPHCYISSEPELKSPQSLNHGDVYFLLRSSRSGPSRTEANLRVGYELRPGSDAQADVGDANFEMMVRGDNAWLVDSAEEDDLVAAMKRGDKMSVRAVSKRGNSTNYIFSLDGVTAAVRQMQKDCPRR